MELLRKLVSAFDFDYNRSKMLDTYKAKPRDVVKIEDAISSEF